MNLREAVRDVLGVREQPGDEWQCYCFSPEHDNRNTPAASINVRKGLWVCYSCGRGGSVEGLLSGVPISDPSATEYLSDVEADLRRIDEADGVTNRRLPEAWLNIYEGRVHPAWYERGVSERAITHFRLGYDYETDCLTYPLRDLDGTLLGVVRRRLDGGKPKYKYPSGINVHDLLFDYHRVLPDVPLVLVEGALDRVAVWDAVQDEMSSCALFGSHLSDHQELMLRRLCAPVVICAFDNDEAGENLAQQVMESELALTTPTVSIDWRDTQEKDIAELSVAGRRKILNQALDAA